MFNDGVILMMFPKSNSAIEVNLYGFISNYRVD